MLNNIIVACVLKSGGDYTIEYVKKLKNMVMRNTSVKFDFLCFTDLNIPKEICKSIRLLNYWKGWWSKIELFNPNGIHSKRMVYFDLDTVITENIDELFSIDSDFIALKPWNERNRMNGLCASGMMSWMNDGKLSFIYDKFDYISINKYLHGDQEYISDMLKKNNKEPLFFQDLIDGIYSYKRNCRDSLPHDAKIVCFHGKPRLHNIKDKWVVDNWV
jgi:hypothetical protein